MNRREFTRTLGFGAAALTVGRGRGQVEAIPTHQTSQIAITMDDFSWHDAVKLTATERNQAILGALSSHTIKAGLFVIGRNIDSEEGKQLLSDWDRAGHLIGNHTYSHRSYSSPKMSVSEYEEDILRAETLLKTFPGFRKYFRFPMLKEGDTASRRDAMRTFLARQGYHIGHVTIDNSDWIVDQRLTTRLKKEPDADVTRYRDFYLEHMWDRAQYYDSLARRVVGRPVKHTILMHFNLLNGLFLDNLLEMFKAKGWQLIDAQEAFKDAVFAAEPKVIPAGESIIWSLAKEKGTIAKSLRYPAEDGDYEKARMNKLGL